MINKILRITSFGVRNVFADRKVKSNLNIELNSTNSGEFIFCFFGEFGYGLTTWLPFLNQVSINTGIKLKTCGLNGSSVFFSNFSDNHTEISIKSLNMMGNDRGHGEIYQVYRSVRKRFPKEKIIFPTVGITINGTEWKNTSLHMNFDFRCGNFINLPPLPSQDNCTEPNGRKKVVINIKDYHNWGNDAIRNYYTEEDLLKIVRRHSEDDIFINYPSLPREDSSSGYFRVNLPKAPNIVQASSIYKNCKTIGDINKTQIQLLASSDLIYATQGGNAILSILCGKKINIIMRGGFDYPDFTYLEKKLVKTVKIFYEIPHEK